jgi:hypothetical protein
MMKRGRKHSHVLVSGATIEELSWKENHQVRSLERLQYIIAHPNGPENLGDFPRMFTRNGKARLSYPGSCRVHHVRCT